MEDDEILGRKILIWTKVFPVYRSEMRCIDTSILAQLKELYRKHDDKWWEISHLIHRKHPDYLLMKQLRAKFQKAYHDNRTAATKFD